jgi:hypothetical protein
MRSSGSLRPWLAETEQQQEAQEEKTVIIATNRGINGTEKKNTD